MGKLINVVRQVSGISVAGKINAVGGENSISISFQSRR